MIESKSFQGVHGPTYPVLMVAVVARDATVPVGTIVLFRSYSSGVVIYDPEGKDQVGYHYDNWSHAGFVPFTGTVTLRNL